ncbi:unnamed protein product, partial [Meganyctiphanes norvegica]
TTKPDGYDNTGMPVSTPGYISKEPSTPMSAILIGAITSSIFIIIMLIIAVALYLKKRKTKDELELPPGDIGMGNRHDSDNSLYGDVGGNNNPQVPRRSSQHVSENSLYGAVMARDA